MRQCELYLGLYNSLFAVEIAVAARSARLLVLYAQAFAKQMASTRVCVVEKIMLPQCIMQGCYVFVLRMLLGKQFVLRALRNARQSVRRKRACVRRSIPTYRSRWLERRRRE